MMVVARSGFTCHDTKKHAIETITVINHSAVEHGRAMLETCTGPRRQGWAGTVSIGCC